MKRIYKENYGLFEPFVKDYVRARIYTTIATFIPSSQKDGADALYEMLQLLSDLPQFKPFGVDGETGYFFRSQDVRDLEDKMIALLKGGAKLNQILKGGLRDFVERHYSTTAIANMYRRFFENLLNNRNNG